MKWLRSEIMEYISLIVNEDAAHDCIQKLGDLGVIQFTDLNPELTPFQRRYVSYIKRCDEMERKLRYMENEIIKLHLPIKSAGTIDNFIMGSSNLAYGSNDTALRVLDTLERILEDKELELRQLNQMHERLAGDYNEKKELQEVINKMNELFTIDLPDVSTSASSNMSMIDIRNSEHQQSAASLNQQLNEINKKNDLLRDDNILRFRYLTGVVPTEERLKFERVIFRTTRGNVYMRFSPIKELIIDPITGQSIAKDAFVLFFQTEYLENKLRKICEAFHSHLYTIPSFEDRTAISSLLQNVSVELTQSKQILRKNRESTMLLCMELSEHLQAWKWTILQEKGIYHILNMFRADVTGMLRGEGWVVEAALNDVKMQVERSHHTNDHVMPSLVDLVPRPWPTPPTYFYTNKFTDSYQNFVDTYGTPRYREINPAVFTAVTFPFLFGVMYGDIGHGICLFLAGLYMVLTEKKLENAANMNEMLVSVYNGRYMILMMGIFAIYAGFVYNDFFCLPLNIFGSKYKFPHSCLDEDGLIRTGCEAEYLNGPMNTTDVSNGENVYVFGMDPIWKVSDNELLFFNSFKMKLSVIIGITQMVFGIILRGWNALYFRHYSDFLFEFLPQIIFSCALFVYMVVLIVIKWSINWLERMNPASHCKEFCHPPSLINTLINILLDPTHVEDPMYPNQLATQQTLLTFALLSVPVLLFGKPVYLKIVSMCKPRHENEEPLEFGEIFIHQSIETIEFVLGMVSNTASYLRLWALSLAHAELAQVFWEKAMLSQINSNNFFMVFIGFAIFAGVTTGVLLMMDVLECFLHALRLHWVEFQNKFYKADGLRFEPFSFKDILKGGNL